MQELSGPQDVEATAQAHIWLWFIGFPRRHSFQVPNVFINMSVSKPCQRFVHQVNQSSLFVFFPESQEFLVAETELQVSPRHRKIEDEKNSREDVMSKSVSGCCQTFSHFLLRGRFKWNCVNFIVNAGVVQTLFPSLKFPRLSAIGIRVEHVHVAFIECYEDKLL